MFPVTDPILVFTILVAAMVVAPVFSRKLRIPDLVLLLGFGALLGPHGLNMLERNSAVTLLGEVGLLYIMFLAGIEIDLYRFRRSYKRSVGFGLLTFIVPQGLGTLAGRYLLGMEWPASLLLASMFASHTLLAYPLASRLGISRSEPVAITVGATIITDTLALLVLAVVADSARGVELTPLFWATIVFGMTALTLLIMKGIPAVARWFFQRVSEESNMQFLFVIAVVCGCSYLSHFARMEPIIGAFLTGAAFNRLIPAKSALMNRVTFAGHTLFIPFFLISVGMMVDPRAMLTGARSWLVGATMIAAVVLTKFAAAQIARRAFGYSRAAGQVMFGLSVVQAAATLAAVVVGYNLKIFDEPVLNGAVLMILATCLLGSWVVDRYGRQMAAEAPARPASARAEQRLLVPVAHPDSATRLLDLAFLLRSTSRPGGVYPLAIARDQGDTEAAVVCGENLLGRCLAHAASVDMPARPELRVAVNVSDGIVHAARELRSTSVVIGWAEDQAASIRIFGSVTSHLVEACASRLLFCRLTGPLNTTRRLLVPFPSLAARRRDMPALVADCKTLAHLIGAELQVYLCTGDAASLQPLIEKTKPSCRLSLSEAPTWEQIRQELFAQIRHDDMILLPVDRRNGILWTPALDHLPELIAKQFPEVNLLIDYPSLRGSDEEDLRGAIDQEGSFPQMLPAELDPDCTLEQALHRLTETAFSREPETARRALARLLDSAQSYPVELAPGTVLVHARCGDLERPVLMVCHAREGWPMPDLPPAKIILVLLGAQTQSPEQHLKTLSSVAGRMHEAGQKEAFRSAADAQEICEQLAATDPEDIV
jgi:Kef-type K+ transport system membrane component KefB/mannitol/fructose-specific phosphotransferase system IIA component (Ntr-type)